MTEPKARVQIEEGVAFASAGGRELRCDVFRPAGQTGPQPGVLFVHGGSWHGGGRAMMRGYGILMARNGYPCVASEYRLSGEAKWPAQLDDVLAAGLLAKEHRGLSSRDLLHLASSASIRIASCSGVSPRART